MLKETVQKELVASMKAHNEVRLSTMRLLLSAINYDRINKMHELSESEELDVVKKEAKKRNDAIEMYTKVGEIERANKEKEELTILQEFLPAALSLNELESLVDQSIAEVGREFGPVMKHVLIMVAGRADGKQVSEVVRAKLQ